MKIRLFLIVVLVCVTLGAAVGGSQLASASGDITLERSPWRIGNIQRDAQVSWVSAAFEPRTRQPMAAYYDAALTYFIRATRLGPNLGNCGDGLAWDCDQVKTGTGIGQYSDSANYGDLAGRYYRIGYVYYDDYVSSVPKLYYFACYGDRDNPTAYYCNGSKLLEFSELPSGTIGSAAALAFNEDGDEHIVVVLNSSDQSYLMYIHPSAGTTTGTCYDYGGSGDWDCDIIVQGPGAAEDPSIVIAADGKPRIAYYDAANGRLQLAYPSTEEQNCGPSTTWRCVMIDGAEALQADSETGLFPSIGLGDALHIAYYDRGLGNLRLASYVGSEGNCGLDWDGEALVNQWQCETIDTVGSGLTRMGLELRMDGSYPLVGYMDADDASTTAVRLAQPAERLGVVGNCGPAGAWDCQVIDQGEHDLGAELDLVVNTAGGVTLVYLETPEEIPEEIPEESETVSLWMAYQIYGGYLPLISRLK